MSVLITSEGNKLKILLENNFQFEFFMTKLLNIFRTCGFIHSQLEQPKSYKHNYFKPHTHVSLVFKEEYI